MQENAVIAAFDVARKKFDSMAIVCGILDVSSSYVYKAMNDGELSLPCALKMELLLEGEFTWRQLCPRAKQEVDSIKERISQV